MWDRFIVHRPTLGFAGSDIHQNLPPLFEGADGEPEGLDFIALDSAGRRYELGSVLNVSADLTLRFTPPRIPEGSALSARLLRITAPLNEPPGVAPVRELLAESHGEPISYIVDAPGAYRVEVTLTPEHLRAELGSLADLLLHPVPWIYSNPIYIQP